MVRYHKRQEKDMDLAQKARIKAIAHLQSISEYSSSNRSTNKLDLGETSSACPSKMGEGRDGPSHSPLPKVLVRSEEESLKSPEVCFPNGCDMDLEARLKEDYLEASSILGGSTSASLDKHLKRKLSDRYLDFTNNVK
jgi:hypothetical protein